MQMIELASTGRTTTRLGFGGSSLMGSLGRRQSLALLESAFSAGIRHFDVAPMYGYGEAEACLGEFLSRHRSTVTVTTKFGIAPPRQNGLISAARSIARPILGLFPGLKQRAQRAATVVAVPSERPSFTAEAARASLERSLRELRTDFIDLWLLHEATASDLRDERLLRMLEDAVTSGLIGAFGVGSDQAQIPELLAEQPRYCRVVQCEWSVFDAAVAGYDGFRLHHRALSGKCNTLHSMLARNDSQLRSWSDEVGMDISQPELLAQLMLKAALEANPASIVLFSSKKPANIRRNVATAADLSLQGPALRLHALVQREFSSDWSEQVR